MDDCLMQKGKKPEFLHLFNSEYSQFLEWCCCIYHFWYVNSHEFYSERKAHIITFSYYVLFAGNSLGRVACCVGEELLFIIPVVNLVSSPCKSVKVVATDLLILLEKLLVNLLNSPKLELTMPGELLHVSRLEDIILRLLQHLWMQVCYSLFISN